MDGLDSLCWRDLHPLEWQLTSLHQTRTCRFPAPHASDGQASENP
jgi:hypothetical protein